MKKTVSYLYVILGAACWGFLGLFNRLLTEAGASLWTRVFIRNFFTLLLLTAVFALFRRQVFRIQRRHIPLFLGSGLLSVLCLAVVYFNCQTLCSLAVAGTLLYLAPSFVVLLSALLWRAPLTRRKIICLLVSLLGCALVSGIIGGGDVKAPLAGVLLGVAAGFCYGTYTIFAHYGLQHYDSYTMIYWTFFVSGIGSLAFLRPHELAAVLSVPKGAWAAAGFVVIATVLPYILYTKGLEGIDAGKASIIANVEPVMEALVGVVVFHERLSLWTVAGVVCVLGSVVLLAGEKGASGDKKTAPAQRV